MTRRTNPLKLLLRNLCFSGLTSPAATEELKRRGHRIEVATVDDLNLQVKLYGEGNPLPAYLNITVKGTV